MLSIIDKGDLSRVNTTYINRKSLNLLTCDYPNTFLRVGERYVALLLWLFRFRKGRETENFDYTGFALQFFEHCETHGFSVLLLGGELKEVDVFIRKLKVFCPNLNVEGYNGYMGVDECVLRYVNIKPDICVLGLGNPKQNLVLDRLANLGYVGIHTCGAFISQEGRLVPVYSKGRLPRWVMRSLKERGHFKRVLITSFTSLITILRLAVRRV